MILLLVALAGPIAAEYLSAYDGDSIRVQASIWPGITATTSVRVRGVDTPEIRGRCESERELAIAARDYVRAWASQGRLELRDIEPDKYGNRVLADVWIDGERLADVLIQRGLGRAYDGGRREGWCD